MKNVLKTFAVSCSQLQHNLNQLLNNFSQTAQSSW